MDIYMFFYVAVVLTVLNFGNASWLGIDNFPGEFPPAPIEAEGIPFHIPPEWKDEEHDFIIVGSGSAGSVIANRLSEIPDCKILLLEAGYQESGLSEFPLLAGLLQFTDHNWGYVTEPEKKGCQAMEERRCAWPRGKALGGSTVINYMIYTRGCPEDYDRWAALGNPGWSYPEVLPYFLKSENSELKDSDKAYHNEGGNLNVAEPFASTLADLFLVAGEMLGYKTIDYNSPEQIGFGKIQATLKKGRRYSVAKAFLNPIINRKNLQIFTGATVSKILIDRFTNRAYGVEYIKNNQTFLARARKEVILSAGVIGSPQLLMLSGIGPKAHLDALGISTVSDLPVGETLYDHILFPGIVIYTNMTTSSGRGLDPSQLVQWYATGEGPLSSVAGVDAVAFIKANGSQDENYPDIELFIRPSSIITDNGTIFKKISRLSDEYYQKMYSSLPTTYSFSISPILLHPKSKGYIKLNSANIYDSPRLYGNYFTDPEKLDLQTLRESIRTIYKLCDTNAFKSIDAKILEKPFVRCEQFPWGSDEHWHCALSQLSTTGFHQMSTCKMGPPDDKTAVVNHELKVYGIENLRVADSSVIPIPLSGHTNAPTIMIGEMASDLIKRDWKINAVEPKVLVNLLYESIKL